jgi:hypothetical protein
MTRLQVEAGTAVDLGDGAIACTAAESLTPDKQFVLRARKPSGTVSVRQVPDGSPAEPRGWEDLD